jgi:hypothetical protein
MIGRKRQARRAKLETLVTKIMKDMPGGHYERMMRRMDQGTITIAAADDAVSSVKSS